MPSEAKPFSAEEIERFDHQINGDLVRRFIATIRERDKRIESKKIDLPALASELLRHGVGAPWFQHETAMRQEKLLEEWLAEEIGE